MWHNSLPFSVSTQVEVCSPRISHLLSFCCDAFTKEQLCNLECLILLRLNFRLAAPTLAFFLDYYNNCIEAAQLVSENTGGDRFARHPDTTTPRRCSNLAQKVCELSLADYAFNKYPPSLIASSALWLASDLMEAKQGLSEHAAIRSQEDQWGSFVEELCNQRESAQASKSPEHSEGDSLASLKGHLLSVSQGSYNGTLGRECKDKLKLLVSLNKETLEVISTMWLHLCLVLAKCHPSTLWFLHLAEVKPGVYADLTSCIPQTICWLQPQNVLQLSIVIIYIYW